MKKSIVALTLGSALFAACSKNDSSPAEKSEIKIGSASYTTDTLVTSGNRSIQANVSMIALGVTFADSFPETNGSYRIVRYPDSAGQVQVFAFTNDKEYRSTGLDNKSITVEKTGSHLKITIPETWAKDDDSGDSVLVSGKIVAPNDFLNM